MKKSLFMSLFIFFFVTLGFQSWVTSSHGNDYLIHVDATSHQKFGLYYPVTYKFSIPSGANSLAAQFKYSSDGTWNTLPEKTSSDTFNGIDAVRFDYAGGFAYVSVGLSRSTDYLYLRILDGTGQPVDMTFDSIPKYYDGRRAAVTITIDDWSNWCDSYFRTATDYLFSYGLYFTVGIIAGNTSSAWSSMQEKINQDGDYLEIACHSWDHPCSATAYTATGYQTEVIGSRDAIRSNLTFKANPYIPLYVEPCGYSDATLVSWVTAGDYLLTRTADTGFTSGSNFIAWDSSQGRYGRAVVVYSTSGKSDDINLLNGTNSAFDQAMTQGGIYLLMDHPWQGLWYDGSYLLQHLNYIKGRNDVWYVPFGQLYQYHFLQEMRGNLSIQQIGTSAPVANFTATPRTGSPPLSVTFTDTSTGTITGWLWDFGDSTTSTQQNPVHVYNNTGAYSVKLTVTGPDGSNTKTQTNYITVSQVAPVANFTATPLTGRAPLTVTFTDSSIGTITGWSWNFGDSTTSTSQKPVHVYSRSGNYTVKLTVTGPVGSSTKTRTNYVRVRTK